MVRAALESIAYQSRDLIDALQADLGAGGRLTALKVDGGAVKNDLLMQFQADVADVAVERPTEVESTGRGAAMLAGLGAGLSDIGAVRRMWKHDRTFHPTLDRAARVAKIEGWSRAIARARA